MERVETLAEGYRIVQDTELYRFTSDAILLSRFVKVKKGENVADFCAGGGVVGLHFYAENPACGHVTLIEKDAALSALAKKSVELNGLGDVFSVENMPVQDAPARFCEKFSLILCNPPYERAEGGFGKKRAAECSKEISLTLKELCDCAAKCLKFGGRFAICMRADRIAELFSELSARNLQPKKLQFAAGKRGAKPYLALVLAVKGGKSGLDVLPEAYNAK